MNALKAEHAWKQALSEQQHQLQLYKVCCWADLAGASFVGVLGASGSPFGSHTMHAPHSLTP